ncbi:Hydroxymethylpyrimidine ABC transporter, ATPase component [Clostridiaceae bacterium JG1575]|nr:Hydroxymethylpyrimidine ABC transporter, ATPase component [Clostridiaceae bacterium JG1575]
MTSSHKSQEAPASQPLVLSVERVKKSFGGQTVLSDLSLAVREGELVSLLGLSGAGKTTLFNIIAGLGRPDSGRVLLRGTDRTGQAGYVSYMLQKDLLLPYKTVLDNIALPLVIRGEKKERARSKALAHFAAFGLEGTQHKYPGQLSGGMRQRSALLRTYLFSSDLALLDEPFSALDPITKSAMHRWFLGIMEEIRLTTLFITHDVEEAILLSDRVLILAGTPAHIAFEVTIQEPKPRRQDFPLCAEFLAYKREILGHLLSKE